MHRSQHQLVLSVSASQHLGPVATPAELYRYPKHKACARAQVSQKGALTRLANDRDLNGWAAVACAYFMSCCNCSVRLQAHTVTLSRAALTLGGTADIVCTLLTCMFEGPLQAVSTTNLFSHRCRQMLCERRENLRVYLQVSCPCRASWCHRQEAHFNVTAIPPVACSYAVCACKTKNKPTKNINQLSKLREKVAALRGGDREAALR